MDAKFLELYIVSRLKVKQDPQVYGSVNGKLVCANITNL